MKTSTKRMLLGLLSIIVLATALWLIYISLPQSGQNPSLPKQATTPAVYTELPATHLSPIGVNNRKIEAHELPSIVSKVIYIILFALIVLSAFWQLYRSAIEHHKRKILQNLKKGAE